MWACDLFFLISLLTDSSLPKYPPAGNFEPDFLLLISAMINNLTSEWIRPQQSIQGTNTALPNCNYADLPAREESWAFSPVQHPPATWSCCSRQNHLTPVPVLFMLELSAFPPPPPSPPHLHFSFCCMSGSIEEAAFSYLFLMLFGINILRGTDSTESIPGRLGGGAIHTLNLICQIDLWRWRQVVKDKQPSVLCSAIPWPSEQEGNQTHREDVDYLRLCISNSVRKTRCEIQTRLGGSQVWVWIWVLAGHKSQP